MTSITLEISETRTITATGRLVAGETAQVSVVGATPKKLYLINAARDVIAYCDTFDGGNGTINLATEQIAAIVATIPAGRAFSVSCIVEGEDDAIVGYGFVPMVSAPMPADLENVEVDLYLRASTIRALFADIPETYSNQRSLSVALSQVVNILKTIGLAACVAFTALATEWQDVPANTIIGDGLTLTNGEIRAAGGGTDGNAVTNIVNGIVADKSLMVNEQGEVTNRSDVSFGGMEVGRFFSAAGSMAMYHPGGIAEDEEFAAEDEVARQGDLAPYAKTANLGSAAYRDASDFATATDEALAYQLITNRLSGVTFDFATVAGLYLAISNIVAAQGGAITNFPAIP